MTDILHLPGWKATATRHEGPELVIEADYIEPAAACKNVACKRRG